MGTKTKGAAHMDKNIPPRFYIIVSFKHGSNGNLCFWRPNNCGYTTDLQQAGRYTEEQVKANMNYYHDGDNVAIEESKLLQDFKVRVHLETNYFKVRKYKKLAERGLLSLNSQKDLQH